MRRGNLVIGSVIILVGILLLVNQLVPTLNIIKFIFPLVLIVLGLWFLAGRKLFVRECKKESMSLPLNGIQEADIHLRHGAGRLFINALSDSRELLAGTFDGGVDQEAERNGDRLKLRLRTPSDMFFGFPSIGSMGFCWSFGLNPNIRLKLSLHSGANEAELDLTDLKLSELTLSTGASSTHLKLPAQAGFTQVKIESGAAAVSIKVPYGVAGRIRTKGTGVSSINVDTTRFVAGREGYESIDYETATNKADIIVSTGVGSIDIS